MAGRKFAILLQQTYLHRVMAAARRRDDGSTRNGCQWIEEIALESEARGLEFDAGRQQVENFAVE